MGTPWRALAIGMLLVGVGVGGSVFVLARGAQSATRAHLAAQLAQDTQQLVLALRAAAPQVALAEALERALLVGRDDYAIFTPGGLQSAHSAGAPPIPDLIERVESRRAVLAGWGASAQDLAGVTAAVRLEEGSDPKILWTRRPAPQSATDVALTPALTSGVLAAVGMALAVHVASRRIRRSLLSRVIDTARNLSAGDLDAPFESGGEEHLTTLVSSLNIVRRRLRAQLQTIDAQRRELESLVDQLQEGVILTRADGRVALMNPVARRWLALPADQGSTAPIGRPIEACVASHDLLRLFLATRPSQESAAGLLAEDVEESRASLEIDTPEGRKFLFVTASWLAPAAGANASAGRLVVLSDVSELQKTIQLRTDFVANASHELRTPLSIIRAAVEALDGIEIDQHAAQARKFIDTINRHSQRLERLIADLLDLSRLETPEARFEPEAIPAARLVEELRARFGEELERRQQRWQTEVEAGLSAIHANPQLVRLALDNLVSNAIRFTDAGGRISVTLRSSGESVELEVSDSGCGIPYQDQERVFERFYQVERGRSGPERGTGLGLSIVRHAVIAMRGQVRLRSAPGRGTTVTLLLPAASTADATRGADRIFTKP